jgi:hypothetical protein
MDKPFFLILGMHRSGTSCLTGSLERCGVYLGEVKRKGKHNQKGYFEKEEVYKIHDQILRMNKGTWDAPPKSSIQIHPHHSQQLTKIIQELQIKRPCGLKDPRLLLLLDIWKELTGQHYQFIGTFRHPLAVAHSLQKRNNITIEEGLVLWQKYNSILVDCHKKEAFPLIEFNLTRPKKYLQNILFIAKQMELRPQKFRLKRFITSKLEHHRFQEEKIPSSCQLIYNYLLDKSI